MKLTEKQRRFAEEYIKTGNASVSARNAGYSEAYAKTHVYKLLENARVKAYIDKRLNELKKKSIAQQDEVLQFLTSSMRGEVRETIPIGIGDGAQELVEVVPNVATRQKAAIELLKRYDVASLNYLNEELKRRQIKILDKELSSENSQEDKIKSLMGMITEAIRDE